MTAQSSLTLDDNTKIAFVEVEGSGRPVLFVPGWTFTSKAFEHQLATLKGRHRAIAIDPRGQGASDKPAGGNTYQQHGKDIAQVIAKLGLQKPVLVGWSNGCLANYAYVQQYGTGNLGGFVCIDASAYPKGTWSLGPIVDKWVVDANQDYAKFLSDFAGFLAMGQLPAVKDAIEAQMKGADRISALALLEDGVKANYTEQAKAISGAGIRFLYAVDNKMAEGKWYAAAEAWCAENAPKAQVVALAGGHMGFALQPEAFNRTLVEFLAALPASP